MNELSFGLELARVDDARTLAIMARDEIESGTGWRYTPREMRRLIAERETVVLTARLATPESSDELIAGFGVMRYRSQDAHLILLAVDRAHRRKGVGRQMLAWLEKTARVAGIEHIHLEVRQYNAPAIAFYEAFGYRKVELIRDYYHTPIGTTENAWSMKRTIER